MKKTLKTVLSGLFAVLLMAGCTNVFNPSDTGGGDGGEGTVILSLAGTGGRTLLPADPVFTTYDVVFSRQGVADVSHTGIAAGDLSGPKAFKLAAGTWTVTVTGYQLIAGEIAARAAASGGASLTVAAGTSTPVPVELKPMLTGGKGIFAYAITLPASPAVVTAADVALKKGETAVLTVDLLTAAVSGSASGSEELDPGYYDLFLSLTDGEGGIYGEYHALYIYSGLVTAFGSSTAPVDLAALLFASKTPTVATGNDVFTKTGVSQSPVTFTLASSHTGAWNAYAAVSGGEPLTDITLSFDGQTKALTLSAAGGVPAGDYYVSVTETGKAESLRLKLTLTDPVSSPPAAASGNTEVKKNGVGAKSVVFTLTSTHDAASGWTAYANPTGGTPLTTTTGTYDSSTKKLTLTETSGVGLTARIYYVAVAEPDKAESSRLALTVIEGDLPTKVTYAVNNAGDAFVGIDEYDELLAEISESTLAYPEVNGLKVVNINTGTINLGAYAGGYFGEDEWSMELSMMVPRINTKYDVLAFYTDEGKNKPGTMRVEAPNNANWIFYAYTGSSTPAGNRRISFSQPTANIWRHMAFVKTADDTVIIYLDGVQAAQFTGFTEFDNAAFKNITTVELGGLDNTRIYKYVIHKKALDLTTDAAIFAQAKADIDTLNTSAYVTFNPNGGNWDSSTASVVKPVIKPATTVALPPDPEKDDHAFVGWNTAQGGTGTSFDAATTVSTDIEVYAQWVDVTSSYDVVFNANGGTWDDPYTGNGTLTDNAVTVTNLFSAGSSLGTTGMPDSAKVTLTNYDFDSWNTQADGGGSVFDGATAVTGTTTTVYAVWKVSNPAAFLKLRHDFDPARFSGGLFTPAAGDNGTLVTKGTPKNSGWERGSGTYNSKTFYYFKTGAKMAMSAGASYLDLGTGAGDILKAATKGYTVSAYLKIEGDRTGTGSFIWTFAEGNNNPTNGIYFIANATRVDHVTKQQNSEKLFALPAADRSKIANGTWLHVAYTQAGTGANNARLYINGVEALAGTMSVLPASLSGNLTFNALAGPCFTADNNLSQTMFTDFRIYDEALEADQIAALAGDLEDLNAVSDWAAIADSAAPTTNSPVVYKTSASQASVSFTLTSTNDGAWKLYDAPVAGSEISGVTSSFSSGTLTLTHASDVPAGVYYAAVTETSKAESPRLELRVRDPIPSTGLIFELDFGATEGSTTATTGTAALNGSINYGDGVKGKAAVFNGTAANYLSVTHEDGGSLLTGLSEFSVSFWVKKPNGLSWLFYAAPNANAQVNNTPTYVAALVGNNQTKLEVQRYLNARSNSFTTTDTSIPSDNTWKHVVLVFTATDYTAYIDGAQAGTSSTNIQPITGILGAASILYIGRANWGNNGEGATGSIDEYKIYSKALTAAEASALYTTENSSGGGDPDPQSSGPVSLNFSGIPGDMSLSLSASSVSKSGSLTVSVQNQGSYTNFEWWLNGVKQTETGAEYSVDVSSLSLGLHRVTAAALRGAVPCSARAAFTVIS